MDVTIDISDIKKRPADHRGRVNLGAEFGDQVLHVAVLEAEPKADADDDETADTDGNTVDSIDHEDIEVADE
jgi:hypothetical protein